MWLMWDGPNTLIVNVEEYIKSQPVEFSQISHVIDQVRERAQPVHAHIDISKLKISQVNLTGMIEIIWDLHENTKNERFLQSVNFTGASRRATCLWRTISSILPKFVSGMIRFF